MAAAGFSAIETTVVVGVTSILAATAAPQIQEHLESARCIKASSDVRVIALSLVRLTTDVHRIRLGQQVAPTLLVTDGETPGASGVTARGWIAPLDGDHTQRLEAHLVTNAADYAAAPAGLAPGWRGPYMDKLSPDPWGARYAVNVGLLEQPGGHAVMVVSAGPNGIIETPFETVGLQTGGDDVIGLIGRGR